MNRILLAMAAVPLLAGAARAAPLCRDLKGLYTPCTGERTPPHATRRRSTARSADAAVPGDPADAAPGVAARPAKPPIIARTKLCRDLKGLFTPCPR